MQYTMNIVLLTRVSAEVGYLYFNNKLFFSFIDTFTKRLMTYFCFTFIRLVVT